MLDEQAISMLLLARKMWKMAVRGILNNFRIHVTEKKKKKNLRGTFGLHRTDLRAPAFLCHNQIFEWSTRHLLVILSRNCHQGTCFSFVLTTVRNFVTLMVDPMLLYRLFCIFSLSYSMHMHHSCLLRGQPCLLAMPLPRKHWARWVIKTIL